MRSAGASAGESEPARGRDDMGCPSAADDAAALLVAHLTIAAVRSCGCERERDILGGKPALPWPSRIERGPVSLRGGIGNSTVGATGLVARVVVGAVLGRRSVAAKSGVSGVGVGREPERSGAICMLRSGSGLGGGGGSGGSLILLPTCLPGGLERERLWTVVLVSRRRRLESPTGSSCVTPEGEPSGSLASAGVRITTGRSGTGPISSVLSCQGRLGEVEPPPRAALAASELTRVRGCCTVPDAAPLAPEEIALCRGLLTRRGMARHLSQGMGLGMEAS